MGYIDISFKLGSPYLYFDKAVILFVSSSQKF